VLRAAVRHTGVKAISKENWISALTVAMLLCQIECMLGLYQRKLSYQRAVQLVGSATPALSVTARPSSLKHAAIKAEHNAKRLLLQKSAINFSCAIPFNAIPQLVEDRFWQQEN
jgi:hypothetical protein